MTNDTSIISQSFSFKIEFANIKSISSSHNLNVKFKLGSEDNEGNEVINTEINKFNKKNDNPKKPEKKQEKHEKLTLGKKIDPKQRPKTPFTETKARVKLKNDHDTAATDFNKTKKHDEKKTTEKKTVEKNTKVTDRKKRTCC